MRLTDLLHSTSSRRGSRLWLASACAGALLLLPAVTTAQNTDDDGNLPVAGGGSSTSGGGSTSSDTGSGIVSVSGYFEAKATDAAAAVVRVSSVTGQATAVDGAPADQATFQAQPGTAVAEQAGADVLLQGKGQLIVPDTLPMTFEAPGDSIAGTAILLVDDGTASLDDLLSGKAQPAQVMVVGPVTSVHLQGFQALVTNHAQQLAGTRVTLVYLSVDKQGLLHVSAVRAATDGGPLDVVTG